MSMGIPHVPCRAVNCSGVNAGSSVAPRNVHLHVTARRSEAMLSFRISVGGSPLLNLGPAANGHLRFQGDNSDMGLEDDIYHNLRAQDRRSESRGVISDLV